jgi:imidazole glycerol-phosphate synthase subunit HisH
MIALVDYGIGNLRSVNKALSAVGADVVQTDDPNIILKAEKVVLPGVGAFHDGMQGLSKRNLIPILRAIILKQTPLLGICLGMQLLFERSSEYGLTKGLGFVSGNVKKFSTDELKVPQTGWNQITAVKASPLLAGVESNAYVYFNHSYFCLPKNCEEILTLTEYGDHYASAIKKENLYGVQFHPEKSQKIGLKILRNFVERC